MFLVHKRSIKIIFCVLALFQASCVSQVLQDSQSEIKKLGLNSTAKRDFLVLRSDMHSMNGDWLLAQMDLENAIKIKSSGELRLRKALVLAQRGQFEDAKVELEGLLKLEDMSDNLDAQLAYGEVLALLNNATDSLTAYKKALSIDPNNHKAIIFLGAIYSQLKEYEQAKNYFKRLQGIEEYKYLSGYYLGRLEQQLENYKNSEKYFEECLNIKPDFTDCIFSLVESLTLQKKTKLAISKIEGFVEVNPDSDRAFAKLYDLYLEEDDQEKAFQQLVQLERFEPQNRFIKMQMALHLVEKNENELAIEKLNEVVKLSPNFGKTYFLLSTIYERQGDEKKAKHYYSKIAKNQPIYIEASIQRAKDIEAKIGPKEALKFLNSVENSGSDTRVSLYIAILQNKLGFVDQSIKTLRQVVKKNPNDIQILYYLGHIEGEAGEMGRAIVNMKKVIQLDPTHSDALNYLAFYYAENKLLLDEAESLAKKALEIKPDDGHYQDTMGWIYYHKGQYDLALKHLEKAYILHPEEPVIAEHLAAVYSVKGLKEKAKQVYTKLIEKGIGDREKFQRQINSISISK